MEELLPSIAAFLNKAVQILEENNSDLAKTGKELAKALKPIETGKIEA